MKITEMRSSLDGKFFIAGSSDGEIIVINSETGERFGAYQTKFESGGRRMCVSDDGEYFAAEVTAETFRFTKPKRAKQSTATIRFSTRKICGFHSIKNSFSFSIRTLCT